MALPTPKNLDDQAVHRSGTDVPAVGEQVSGGGTTLLPGGAGDQDNASWAGATKDPRGGGWLAAAPRLPGWIDEGIGYLHWQARQQAGRTVHA
ncbi:hypothetical protein NE236_08155 [Actinoallomurus purpureus]|uniref:hypothetical protein n=1 Tax=Actinoallomurus purpureus TaxID=478114 RepID=UPI0020939B0F|nr:hypothetical protein [Actinoallomurus purpureus]MCO6004952.1 hypothetical protein [Actinoallomurus purpureus]